MKWLVVFAMPLTGCSAAQDPSARESGLQPDEVQSGYVFLQPETKALQDDDFANPGLLWLDRGEVMFNQLTDNGREACSSCHNQDTRSLVGTAAHYPMVDDASGTLMNIEARINLCRERYQDLPPLAYESDELLGLTTYVTSLSRGTPIAVDTSGPAAKFYDAGEAYFFLRKGQFNLACSQCHNENWGKKLRGDTISQGHGNAFPAYRMEWQSLGSLQRRLRDCDAGIRAEPLEYGSETYTAVELYLAKRAEGLRVESPGVRR